MSLERRLHRCVHCGKPFKRKEQADACEQNHEQERGGR